MGSVFAVEHFKSDKNIARIDENIVIQKGEIPEERSVTWSQVEKNEIDLGEEEGESLKDLEEEKKEVEDKLEKSEAKETGKKENKKPVEKKISSLEKDKAPVGTRMLKETSSKKVSLTISAGTILNKKKEAPQSVVKLVPKDGIIFSKDVDFVEGDTVFDLLQREMKNSKIHMEYTSSPSKKTSYVEGINNIYEFDLGPLSGWMYRVNGDFPNYGASQVKLEAGDSIEWLYTCDLGEDIGGKNTVGDE